jgi:hypothetical protein
MKWIPALLAAGLAVSLGGCGEIGRDWKGLRLMPAEVVGQPAIRAVPRGSPARTVLEWYRAVQRRDAAGAMRLYSRRVRPTPDAMHYEFTATGGFFAGVTLDRVADVTARRGRATVFTELRYRWQAPNGRGVEVHQPQAFPLVREGGQWRLADDYFMRFVGSSPLAKPTLS